MWEYWIHDLRTGEPQVQVYPADCSWERQLGSRGTGDFTFRVTDRTSIPRYGAGHELVKPNDRVLVVRWGNFVAYAGYVGRWRYAQKSHVSVRTQGIRSFFERRFMGRPMTYGSGWNLSYTDRSPSGAVNVILNRATALTTEYYMPLDLPPYTAGGLSRQARYYETLSADDLLTEIEDGGATIDFAPYIQDGLLRWRVSAWYEIDRGSLDLNLYAPDSPVRNLEVVCDGIDQASGVLAVGKGEGADMMTSYASSDAADVPALVRKVEVKDLDRVDEVTRVAQQTLAENVLAAEQWSFDLMLDPLSPADVEPGSFINMHVHGDDWLPDGAREMQIISLKGNMSNLVTPEVQL